MKTPAMILTPALMVALSACTTTQPVEVTRFHVGNPVRAGTFTIEEAPDNRDVGLEFRTYAGAVEAELQRAGFTPARAGTPADISARVGFSRDFRPAGVDRSGNPVSVGVGGGVGSGGYSGLGVGIGINLSGKPKDIVTTQLQVQLRRRSDSATIWEGRALTEAKVNAPDAQPEAAARKLASALIGGYPGESGRTITVK